MIHKLAMRLSLMGQLAPRAESANMSAWNVCGPGVAGRSQQHQIVLRMYGCLDVVGFCLCWTEAPGFALVSARTRRDDGTDVTVSFYGQNGEPVSNPAGSLEIVADLVYADNVADDVGAIVRYTGPAPTVLEYPKVDAIKVEPVVVRVHPGRQYKCDPPKACAPEKACGVCGKMNDVGLNCYWCGTAVK
jgi:hypothetical protein